MPSVSGIYEYEEDIEKRLSYDPARVTLKEIGPDVANQILRTQALVGHITPSSTPSGTTVPLPGRIKRDLVTIPKAAWDAIEAHLTRENIADSPFNDDFPNLAWEAIKAGLAKEKLTNDEVNGYVKKAENMQKSMDLLLDLSGELTAHKDDAKELSQEAQNLLNELKTRGIDLWKSEDKAVNKEKISELKKLADSQESNLKSELHILFTTKIQPKIQAIGSIMEALKDIINSNKKVIAAANRLPGR